MVQKPGNLLLQLEREIPENGVLVEVNAAAPERVVECPNTLAQRVWDVAVVHELVLWAPWYANAATVRQVSETACTHACARQQRGPGHARTTESSFSTNS